MIESGVRYDFDALATMLTGDTSYIVKGFSLYGVTVGTEATTIQVQTAGSRLLHPLASESGSVFAVPSSRGIETLNPQTNPRMVGSCQPNSVNFIGVDLRRQADSTTTDIVQFFAPSLNTESGQRTPLRRTLDYVFVVTQTDFSYNRSVAPVAVVTTNAQNCIVSYRDARSLLGRLNPGGAYTNDVTTYGWPGGRPNDESTALTAIAGDKAISDLKSWMNAIMTRMHEIGGGQYWYTPNADRNVHLHTGATVFASTGESFEIDTGNLHWQGLSFGFDNSPRFTLIIADQLTSVPGLTDLASGECIYADLDRTAMAQIVAQKGTLSSLGVSSRPGQRWVIASRVGDNYYVNGQPHPIGSAFSLATTAHAGVTKISIDAVTTPNPIAVGLNTNPTTGYGVATCQGISLNLDVGSAHTLVTPGDLTIGRGTAAGDRNVIIKTEGQCGVTVVGTGDSLAPRLSTRTGGGTPYTSPSLNSTHLDLDGLTQFEGVCDWNIRTIKILPTEPAEGTSGPMGLDKTASFIKYFAKSMLWMSLLGESSPTIQPQKP
jgi:hypothetical protein